MKDLEFFMFWAILLKLHILASEMESFLKTPYLSVRDGKLSNAVRLVEFRARKVAVHTFLWWSQARLLRPPLYLNYRKP